MTQMSFLMTSGPTMSSDGTDDLTERLRRLGLRVGRDSLAAFLLHVHKSRLGPTETLEQLADLEERARAAVNLARRTRFACLGSFRQRSRSPPDPVAPALIGGQLDLRIQSPQFTGSGTDRRLARSTHRQI